MDEVKGIRIVSLTGEKEYGIEDREARQDVQQIMEGAPEAFDTFKEIAEYIAEDGATAAEIIKNVAANAKSIADEITRAKTAEQANATAIADEAKRATAAEQANATAIADEAKRATAAEQANATAIADEAKRATAAEQANATAIADEAKRATAAEQANATAIADEAKRATAAEQALDEKLEQNILSIDINQATGEITATTGADTVYEDIAVDAMTGELTMNINY